MNAKVQVFAPVNPTEEREKVEPRAGIEPAAFASLSYDTKATLLAFGSTRLSHRG